MLSEMNGVQWRFSRAAFAKPFQHDTCGPPGAAVPVPHCAPESGALALLAPGCAAADTSPLEPPFSVSEVNACKTLATARTGRCSVTAEHGHDGDNLHKGHDTPTAFQVFFQITVEEELEQLGGHVCRRHSGFFKQADQDTYPQRCPWKAPFGQPHSA